MATRYIITRGDISYTFDQNTFNCNLLFLLDMLSNYEIQFICICELNTSYIVIGTAKKNIHESQ